MALEHKDLLTLHDKAFNANQITRERASDDMVFYFITQWDDQILSESQLAYRGEFNILKKAGRQIISDLASNPVQVDFEPLDETREDAAELIDGLYRTDDNNNRAVNAYANAKQEAVVCGVGAWLLHTEYVSSRSGNKDQVIRREPIFEANNTVFWEPNAKLSDKSDGDYVSVIIPYSEDGYKALVKELTGEDIETISVESFKHPEHSYTFPWIGGEGKKIYVVKFFHRKKIKTNVLTMTDPFDQTITLRESELAGVMDDMLDSGFEVESEKMVERWEVTEYIASGEKILSSNVIAGEHIPVVPIYGERAYVEGEEHYEGVTRLAKDPQRLRNFQMSYLADIVSQSPREKPIFLPEQLAGQDKYFSLSGAENNYAYIFQNWKSGTGEELPLGPVGTLPAPNIPPALGVSIELSRQAVEDVANPGIPKDIADPDQIAHKTVIALQNRLDMQSMVYQEHYKHGKRRDAEIYASMSIDIIDTPRIRKTTLPDGTTKDVQIMEIVIDKETGDVVTLNDLSNSEFEVYSKIGASYSTQKEQTVERLGEMIVGMDPADPMRKALQLKQLALMDGVEFDDIRDYANKQLVMSGVKEPETDEEKQLLADAQQNQEPEAAMVLARAEDKKGEAQLLEQKRLGIDMQLKAANEEMKREIDAFKAQTGRMGVQVDAEEAGATIENKRIDSFGKQLDNAGKVIQLQLKEMSDDQLFEQIEAG